MKLAQLLHLPALPVCLASVALLAACAQDRPMIDRVQPNITKKSDLIGREWYMRSTVVQTSFTAASTFPGSMSKLTRGVFDAQEKALYFYRTYEFMEGSEAYAQKSDYDTPLKGADGKPVQHAVPQDYQQVTCAADSDCQKGARCADRFRADAWPEEGEWHGYCVRKATKFVYRGAPVLAYPITSHFDIVRDYSAATGEPTNVQNENTSDRKWFDREYMRVAWGSQQVLSFDHDVLSDASPNQSPVIYEGDSAPEDEQFESGQTKLHDTVPQRWFDYTVKVIGNVPTIALAGQGDIPKCYFYPWYIGGVYDCASEELKIRYSFLEVPKFAAEPSRAYVARDSNDVEMEKFGFFRTERPVWDIQFGNTFNAAIRRVERHRIWDKYVKCYTDAASKPEPGKAPVCKALAKDTAWRGDFDYSKMNPVPVVYYLNEDHPRDLVESSKIIAAKWSVPFEDVVAFHKGKKPDHPMFILCENSDAAAKAAIAKGQVVAEWSGTAVGKQFCREMDKPHKFGDVRWSVMHAIPNPIQAGLYGYGPSAADPLTGEILSASAHAYVGVMKSGAESALQNLELLAGIKDFNDIKRASEKVFKGNQMVAKTMDVRSPKQDDPRSVAEAQQAVASMMDPDVRARLQDIGLPLQDNGGTWAQTRLAQIHNAPELDALVSGDDDGHTIASMFKDPRVATIKGPSTYTAEQLKSYSLATWNHTAARAARDKVWSDLGTKTIHFAEFADNAILGLADEYGRQYDKAVCDMYKKETGTLFDSRWTDPATALVTEDGKDYVTCPVADGAGYVSFGAGRGGYCAKVSVPDLADPKKSKEINGVLSCSTKDLMQVLRLAVNTANANSPLAADYKSLPGPLYTNNNDPIVRHTQELGRDLTDKLRADIKLKLWQRIYLGTQEHEIGHTLGLRHNFEASTDAMNFGKEFWALKLKKGSTTEIQNALQPDTYEQALGHIREHQLASVMDYTSKFNGRDAGVGYYDRAAIKFGYGDLVEVFNQFKPEQLDADPDNLGPLAKMSDYLKTPADTQPGTKMLLHQGNTDMNVLNRRLHWSTLPKYFGGADNLYDRKDVRWQDLHGDRCESDADCGGGTICAPFGVDKYCRDKSVVEVPYRFCSDEYDGQTPTCATFDEGVDAYEIARNSLDDYENYWWFYGYARDSEMFYPIFTYTARIERALAVPTRQFQYWAVNFATYQKDGWWKKLTGQDYDQDINGGLPGGVATMQTFNKMAQVVARPSCGFYGYNPAKARFEPYTDVDNAQFSDQKLIDETMGCRPLYPGYDYGGYVYRPFSGGQMIDRLTAMSLLTDPTLPRFIATNESEDTRRYLISFFNVFPRQLTNLMASLSVEDATWYGWQIVQGKNETDDVLVPRAWVGPGAAVQPKACSEFPPSATAEEKRGCLRFNIFPDQRPVFPSSRFRMPLQAAYYGMAIMAKGYNLSFLDVSRIFLAGSKSKIVLPADMPAEDIATFTDPLSGKVYVAPKVAKDTLNPGYMAVKLAEAELKKWNSLTTLQDNYLFSEYQFRVSLLDIVRSMHEVYDK